ncbi:MAG: phosphoenolpyruvate--protein phosphotransferase [Byssovorax sp.]
MIYSAFLPRRLSQPGCLIAGTQLTTHRDKLKAQKIKLSTKVDAAVHAVLEKTKTVELLASTDATMIEIDRGTDRHLAGFDDQLEGIERSFDHASILPLSAGQSARLADAVAVRAALFPEGTGFLKIVYNQQWLRMTAIVKALEDKETSAAVKRLGLTAEAERLAQWVTLYGNKLGLTEAKESDPAVVAVEAWHEAYGELTVHVHSEYGSATDQAQIKIREALVSPYQAQADEERRAEQKARGKRKAGEAVDPAATEKIKK